jgi:hypothetical protein
MMELRQIAKTGFILMIIGLVLSISESLFFAINIPETFHQSIPKLICDIIALMIILIGCFLFLYAIFKKMTIEFKEQFKKLKD